MSALDNSDSLSSTRGLIRYRRIFISSGGSLAARGLSIAATLVSVPLLLGYLGDERYGLFVTVQSIITLTNVLDLGMGNSLVNAVAAAAAHDERDNLRRIIASTFYMQMLISVGMLLLTFAVLPWVDIGGFYNVSNAAIAREAHDATIMFCVLFAASLPVALIGRIQTGYQETHWVALTTAIANGAALAGQFACVKLGASLVWLVAVTAAAPILVQLVTWIVVGLGRPWLIPTLGAFDRRLTRGIIHASAGFLVLQLATLFAFTSDNLVLTRLIDPAAVTQYAVPQRLFGTVIMVIYIAVQPLWPAFGDAKAHGEHDWIKRALWRGFASVFVISSVAALLVCLGFRQIVAVWLHGDFTPDMTIVWSLGLWTVLNASTNIMSVYLNGIGEISAQAAIAVVMSIIALALKIVLVPRIGVVGVVAATLIAYAFISVPWYAMIVRRGLKTA